MLHGDRRDRRRRGIFVATLSLAASMLLPLSGSAQAGDEVADDDWLGIVNAYRSMSGLDAITAESSWSAEGAAHSCYMLSNGISHDEIPGKPGYTAGGDVAGNSGNVAVSSSMSATARDHIDLWLTGPFHAIGILRHNLRRSGFGMCAQASTPTPWRSGATLDVIRGLESAPRPSEPILFPGRGSTVALHSFVTEFPNPMTMCGWTGSAGLPLIAMLPAGVASASSTLTGPNGPIETCTLHPGNTTSDATARAILAGDNAVIVMPRTPLADGTYTASVVSTGGNVSWSFSVDRDAPLGPATPAPQAPIANTAPTADATRLESVNPFRLVDSRQRQGAVRLRAGAIARLSVASADTVAISANFTAVQPSGPGYVTAYNCTPEVPTVSTLGYRPGPAVANQVLVPLAAGELCLYASTDVDIVIDVNGYFRSGGSSGAGYRPVTPVRLHDSRSSAPLAAMTERAIRVVGTPGGAPAGTPAVSLNLTALRTTGAGWLQAYPCGGTSDRDISSVNFAADDVRPNSVVVPVGEDGSVCLRSSVGTDVLVDLTGYFGADGYEFVALVPIRMVDTRDTRTEMNPFTAGAKVGQGRIVRLQIAGTRGVPADARIASVNLTAVQADRRTYLTAYACGDRPTTSNLNLDPSQGVAANGAQVQLDSTGGLCVYVDQPTHLIVDINGIWR